MIDVKAKNVQNIFMGHQFSPRFLASKLVDKFCYLGDMLSVDGDADAAVEARVCKGWNKFRQLVPLLNNKDVSLLMTEKLYTMSQKTSHLGLAI